MKRTKTTSELLEHVRTCDDPACRATVRLQSVGARLVLGKGRHCEIAVVAAAGPKGMQEGEIVDARRAYAKHLGVELGGVVSNGEDPNHIQHAIENHSHNPDSRSPINLGDARAVQVGTRYAIRFPQAR